MQYETARSNLNKFLAKGNHRAGKTRWDAANRIAFVQIKQKSVGVVQEFVHTVLGQDWHVVNREEAGEAFIIIWVHGNP